MPNFPPFPPSLPPYLKGEAIGVEGDEPLGQEHGGIDVLREGGREGGREGRDSAKEGRQHKLECHRGGRQGGRGGGREGRRT